MSDYKYYGILRALPNMSRMTAHGAIDRAPDGYVIEIKPPKRSLEQNARLWASLNEIAQNVVWHGKKLSSDEWKIIFSAALKKQEVMPGIDGGFVAMGQSTSNMTIKEMSEMLEIIYVFGAQHDVIFKE
ncbi:Recombinase NinB [uncultured Caudovirales phage]|uniref:Recombinase NinB n=1 Tax=uncultured Caudovirales phage TaxID=2100421 RepID=A0A6J5LFY6_9CAUD|nr:Recombinase NinB [uncultured Caudovirales phage]